MKTSLIDEDDDDVDGEYIDVHGPNAPATFGWILKMDFIFKKMAFEGAQIEIHVFDKLKIWNQFLRIIGNFFKTGIGFRRAYMLANYIEKY